MTALDTSDLKQVGEFSNFLNKRRLIRSMKNPLDKCTLISIMPKLYPLEHKWTIEPGVFQIPEGTFENPGRLVIGPSSWWKDIDVEQPMLEIPISSIQMAQSVVQDFCNGMLECDMSTAMPGLFFVLGDVPMIKIKTEYKSKLEETKIKQDNWYKKLVRVADSLWARSNGNPLVIWDEMRMAARALNFNDKPWLKDFQIAEMVKCIACGGLKNPQFPVCPVCRAVDQTHPLAKELKFAV